MLSFFISWLYEKYLSKILIASFPKSLHFIPQAVAWTPFSILIPAISNLVLIRKNQKITWFFQEDEQWNFHLLRKSCVVYISCIEVKILKNFYCNRILLWSHILTIWDINLPPYPRNLFWIYTVCCVEIKPERTFFNLSERAFEIILVATFNKELVTNF